MIYPSAMCALPPCCSLSKQHLLQFTLSSEFGLVRLGMAQFVFSSRCWISFPSWFAFGLSHFPETLSQARRLLQNMIWNLTGKGKSPPKEAFPPLLEFYTSLSHCSGNLSAQCLNQCPAGGLNTAGRWGSGHLCAWCLHCPGVCQCASKFLWLPPEGLCCCFSSLSSLCVTFPLSPRPALKTSNGNLEASVVLRGLLGLCIFCVLTSFIAQRDFLRSFFLLCPVVWAISPPPILTGDCHLGA